MFPRNELADCELVPRPLAPFPEFPPGVSRAPVYHHLGGQLLFAQPACAEIRHRFACDVLASWRNLLRMRRFAHELEFCSQNSNAHLCFRFGEIRAVGLKLVGIQR